MRNAKHTLAVVAFDDMVLADFAIPCEIFSRVELKDGTKPYQVKVCGVERNSSNSLCGVAAPFTLRALHNADTIVVPGSMEYTSVAPAALLNSLQRASERGARIASICTGAFILAQAGLLDGLMATTHWVACEALREHFPKLNVDQNALFVDNETILTSAGASAGFDLCLHMIKKDFGAGIAADAARMNVMPLARPGGQAQFIRREPIARHTGALQSLLDYIDQNPGEDLSVIRLAERGAMSVRTLHRKFEAITGMTPAQWVQNSRILYAQTLLETSEKSIEQVALLSGFGSPSTFRERFRAIVGVSPMSYRRAFRGAVATALC